MAENGTETTPNAAAKPAQNPVVMRVIGQYIRDLSFENAVAQNNLQGAGLQPDIQVQVSLDAKKRETEPQYEVITKFKVNARNKSDGKAMFLMELDYAGIFHIENVPAEQMHPFLLIECPRMLFPFVRRIVSDVTRDGGFPPLNLDNVDFMALYRSEIQRQAALKSQQAQPAN
jgi:preprotein translocase subunit SecB